MWYKNITGMFFGLVTKHACDGRTDRWMDKRTDRQNYDSQDCASIAVSRGKKIGHISPIHTEAPWMDVHQMWHSRRSPTSVPSVNCNWN